MPKMFGIDNTPIDYEKQLQEKANSSMLDRWS